MARITKDPEVRRNELMDVAEQLFAEKGIDHTSPSDIIRKAGVAQGTFYYYFKSRDEIIGAIIDRYLERYEKYVDQVAADTALKAPVKLQLMSDALFDLSRQKIRLGMDACNLMRISNHSGYSEHMRDRIIPVIRKIVLQGIDEGFFKVEYPDETAEMLVVLNQHVHDELKRISDPDASRRKVEATMAVMEKALGARKGTFRPRP